MEDEIGNTLPPRQRGDTSEQERAVERQEDGSGQEGEDIDLRIGEHEIPKWVRPAVWSGVPIVIVALYLFVVPILVFLLDDRDMLPDGPKAEAFFEGALGPLIWLQENVKPYEAYLEWLDESF